MQTSAAIGDTNDCKTMVTMKNSLIGHLEKLQVGFFKELSTLKTKSESVCTAQAVDKRSKPSVCCPNLSSFKAGYFIPKGYASTCTSGNAQTFSPIGDYKLDPLNLLATSKSVTMLKLKFQGNGKHSSMVSDCCSFRSSTPSTCYKNEYYYSHSIDTEIASMVSETAAINQADAKIAAAKEYIKNLKDLKVRDIQTMKGICDNESVRANGAAGGNNNFNFMAVNIATKGCQCATATCTAAEVAACTTTVNTCRIGSVVQDKFKSCIKEYGLTINNAETITQSIAVVDKVIELVNGLTTLANTPVGGPHSYKPKTPDASKDVSLAVALLEKSHSPSAVASAAISEVTTLIEQNSAALVKPCPVNQVCIKTKIIDLIKQIRAKLVKSQVDIRSYASKMRTGCATTAKEQLDLFNIAVKKYEERRTETATQYANIQTAIGASSTAETNRGEAQVKRNANLRLREMNSEKCMNYLNFFDNEIIMRTHELMVLKKAMEIIQTMACHKSGTVAPTAYPTQIPPTAQPTRTPTAYPTSVPTFTPTAFPTTQPTDAPTNVAATPAPTAFPTQEPTHTAYPTWAPTAVPTNDPTAVPTFSPTAYPTAFPTVSPTVKATASPTDEPTAFPTPAPTAYPSAYPTQAPTAYPTSQPTTTPTPAPTYTHAPTAAPTTYVETRTCKQGTYAFKAGVFGTEAQYKDKHMIQFNTPHYMQHQKYQLPSMKHGECTAVDTEFNMERTGIWTLKGIQTVKHSYHCCGNDQVYGAIGFVQAKGAVVIKCCAGASGACDAIAPTNVDLCNSPNADYCGLLGANMKWESSTYSASKQVPLAPVAAACGAGQFQYISPSTSKKYCLKYSHNGVANVKTEVPTNSPTLPPTPKPPTVAPTPKKAV